MNSKPLIAILLLAFAGAGGYLLFSRSQLAVEVAAPRRGQAVELVYATGVVEPVVQAVVSPQSAGQLTELMVDEGAAVQAGQPLARLDSAVAAQKVRELEARLELERKALERAQALQNRSAGSVEAVDQARSQQAQTQAQLEAARDQLLRRSLQSPVAGIVLRREGEVGEYLPAGREVFVVGDPTRLRATLEIDEEDFPRLRRGQKVLLTADAFPGQVMAGEVGDITPQGDSVNKSYRVRVQLPPEVKLPVGMTVEANVVLQEKPGVLLAPSTALAAGKLFVVEGGQARLQAVQTGISGVKETEIISGISETARIIVQPPSTLQDGQRVRVMP